MKQYIQFMKHTWWIWVIYAVGLMIINVFFAYLNHILKTN